MRTVTTMQPLPFSENDISVLLAALHNHAVKKRIDIEGAYNLQVKLLSLIGKSMPITLDEAKEIERACR